MVIQPNTHSGLTLVGLLQCKEFLKRLNSNQKNISTLQNNFLGFCVYFKQSLMEKIMRKIADSNTVQKPITIAVVFFTA